MIDELTNWRLFLTRNFEAAQHSVALLLAEVKKLPKYSSYISPQVLNECEKVIRFIPVHHIYWLSG